MNDRLKRAVARFNGLTLRERAAVSVAVSLLTGFLGYSALIAPQRSADRAARAQALQTEAELAALRREMQSLSARASDPDAALRSRVAEVRGELAQVDARLAGLESRLVPPQKVSALLQELIERQRDLRLVRLRTLPVAGLLPQDDKAAAGAPAQAAAGGIYRHGVELTVEGSYPALSAYLADLERLPQQLYWSEASLVADYPVATMKLTVYTISLEKTWLTV